MKTKDIVTVAAGLNMIYDIIDRINVDTGVRITPENIRDYIVTRRQIRATLNAQLGINATSTENG